MKTIVVFGAGGNVGGAVVKLLEGKGEHVIKVGHTIHYRQKWVKKGGDGDDYRFADVGNDTEVKRVTNRLKQNDVMVDGVIYAVGKYERGGYLKRSNYSLSTTPHEVIEAEMKAQFLGLVLVFQAMLPVIAEDGSIIFVSSVAHEHLSHDVISFDQQELLIKQMRDDPATKNRRVKIHHLGFGPIKTDYYDGFRSDKKMHKIDWVAQEIVATLDLPEVTSYK